MISGGRYSARFLGSVLLLLECAGLGPAAAQPVAPAGWSIEQLMSNLRQAGGDRARFAERKQIAILNKPLDSSGTLMYVPPDRLEKRTLAPHQENMVLEGDRLTFESPARNQRRTFSLREHPGIWALVESMRSTLAGDLEKLKRFYAVSLEGSATAWRLILKPVESDMRDVVSEIRIGGARGRIATVEIIEANGDRSLMVVTRDTP